MIRLRRSLAAGLDPHEPSLDALRRALQAALAVEHATIPPYLYALYSLDASRNPEVVRVLESVVVEEMLHLTLAANVLNAVGGAPVLDDPGFVPAYPGLLPGGAVTGVTVHLAPFSIRQLETFLAIEQPERPVDVRRPPRDPITFGELYARIGAVVAALPDAAFAPRHQVGPDLLADAVVVHDRASALVALATAAEQGEGTTTPPLEARGTGLAHYYRLMEINTGRRLIATPGGGPTSDGYAYAGDPVRFDPAGVHDVPTDPPVPAPGTRAALLDDAFNHTYTGLLAALHTLFNGAATADQLDLVVGLMGSLKHQARLMMSDPAGPVGPTFRSLSSPAGARRG